MLSWGGAVDKNLTGKNAESAINFAESSLDSANPLNFANFAESNLDLLCGYAHKNPQFYFNDSFGQKIFDTYLEVLIEPMKSLWSGKKVIIIEGFNSYFGVYNDLLDCAKQVIRLNQYPPFDAFSRIDVILRDAFEVAKKHDKGEVCFVVALGASAKIICVKLAQKGYIAYDMGNASISYDCIIHKKDRTLIDTLNLQKEYILFK